MLFLRRIDCCNLISTAARQKLCNAKFVHAAASSDESINGDLLSKSGSTRPFEEIPEVKGLPFIGTLVDYTRFKGFDPEYCYKLWKKRHAIYGDIFKERHPVSGKYSVYCCSLEDTELMFRYEDRNVTNDGIPGLSYIRNKLGRKEPFMNLTGEEWYKQRKLLNRLLLQNKSVWKYVKVQWDATKHFVEFIDKNKDQTGELKSFVSNLERWAFDVNGIFVLNRSFDPNESVEQTQSNTNIIRWNEIIMSFMSTTLRDITFLDYYESKQFKIATEAMKNLIGAVELIIKDEIKNHKDEVGIPVLKSIMENKDLTHEEKTMLVVDLLLTGLELTVDTSAMMLYCVSQNSRIQEKLRKELIQFADTGDGSGRVLSDLPYMNAFFKEFSRLFPLSFNQTRTYAKDVVYSNYLIPAGITVENTANIMQNRNPKIFKDLNECILERWMGEKSTDNKFALTGPFGFGVRACPGRRFAQQELRLLLVELLRKFRIEYHHEPIVSKLKVTGTPSIPPQFRFVALR